MARSHVCFYLRMNWYFFIKSLISTALGSGPFRAERRRRKVRREIFTIPGLVTARRSILGPLAEGRPGPSCINFYTYCVTFCLLFGISKQSHCFVANMPLSKFTQFCVDLGPKNSGRVKVLTNIMSTSWVTQSFSEKEFWQPQHFHTFGTLSLFWDTFTTLLRCCCCSPIQATTVSSQLG